MRLTALLVFGLAALPAAADELVLRNGSVLQGSVHEEGDRVVVRMDIGTMSFKKVDVREIRRTGDALKEFEAKSAAVKTAQDCVDVAVWAKDRGLQNKANEMYEKALLLEPDHEVARRALGWEKHEGRWLKGDDLMVARGFVKHNGAWIHAELLDRELARQAEERMQNERIKAAERQSAKDFEVEMQRVEIERQRVENEKRWRSDYWSYSTWGWPMGCGTGVVLPSSVMRPGVPALQMRPRTLPPTGSSLVPAVQPFHIVPPR